MAFLGIGKKREITTGTRICLLQSGKDFYTQHMDEGLTGSLYKVLQALTQRQPQTVGLLAVYCDIEPDECKKNVEILLQEKMVSRA